MKLRLFTLKTMAALMARYRKRPARTEMDRRHLAQQRIALVKLDAIGDFILATSFFQTFRARLPGAAVTLFCRRPVGELARHQFPDWTVVEIPWPRKKAARKLLFDRATRRQLQALPPFDLLVDLRAYRDFIEATLSSWIPARQKIALQNAHRPEHRSARLPAERLVYDQLLPLPDYARLPVIPDQQNHALLIHHLFPDLPAAQVNHPRLLVSGAEKQALLERLTPQLKTPFLLVCPGAGAPIREYPTSELARAVIDAVAGTSLAVVVAGGQQDVAKAETFSGALKSSGITTHNLTGNLTLAEHLVLMSLAQAVVCMETSHAHMAGALGIPAVAIIGGGHYGLFAPWGESGTFRWLTHRVPCFGCNWNCIHERPVCIQDLPAGEVAQNLREVLERKADGI